MSLWGLFDFNNKIKKSFEKVKKDINELNLKLNALVYEKEFLKNSLQRLNLSLNSLIEHYKDAITKYNKMHKTHETNFQDLNDEIQQMKNILKMIVQHIKEISLAQKRLEERLKKLEELERRNETLNFDYKRTKKPKRISVELTETERHVLSILMSLKNEYGDKIPVTAILDEIFKGDRNKASTLSNYLNRLEQKGLIKRTRKGRKSYVVVETLI